MNKLNYHTIIVCVNYVDYLSTVYPYNKNVIENISIVSSYDDIETERFCKTNNLFLHKTDAFYRNGDTFNKAGAINDFLLTNYQNRLKNDEWILFADADIIFDECIEKIKFTIQKTKDNYHKKIFSCPRIVCNDEQDYLNETFHNREQSYDVNFWGYFQFFNKNTILSQLDNGIKPIPEFYNASIYDINFVQTYFWEENKVIIRQPVIHIGECGKNWNGRFKNGG